MSKKQLNPKTPTGTRKERDYEKSPFFAPVVFLLLFLALVILFSDFLFSDQMLRGSDTIQAGIFFRSFLVNKVWETGSVPQWNPYIFGGMPFIEAFHGDIFYPLSIQKYFGTLYRSLGMVLFFHIFLAGIFMYLCARQFKLSKTASMVSAIGYMFASYLVSFVAPGHDGKIFVTTLFPLTILFLDRGFESDKFFKAFFNFSVLGLTIGIIILSPHPQMSYYTLWAVSFYAAFKLISNFVKSKSVPGFLKPAMLTTYAVVIGLLFSAIQFYPGYIYTSEFSPRSDTKQGWQWATSWSLHEEEAFSLLIPEFSGVSSSNPDYSNSTFYWGKNAFKDNSESVGIITLFLALLGVIFSRKKEAYFFGGLALFALVYALGGTTPVFKIFYYVIPKVKSLRAASMIMFLFSFSTALLAGMGLQRIIDYNKAKEAISRNFKIILFGFPGLLFLLALLFATNGKGMLESWIGMFFDLDSYTYRYGYSAEGLLRLLQNSTQQMSLTAEGALRILNQQNLAVAMKNLGAIQTGAWLSFLFTSMAAGVIWVYRKFKLPVVFLTVLLLVMTIHGMQFNKRFISTYDCESEWAPNQITEYLNKVDHKFRVMNFATAYIKEDFFPNFGIDVVVGYHGNQLKWYDALLGGPEKANQENPNFLNLAGAEYLFITDQDNFPENYFGAKPLRQLADLRYFKMVINDNALPRIYLADKFKIFDSLEQVEQAVLSGPNVFRDTVYLEETPTLTYQLDSLDADSVWFVDYQTDSVLINGNISKNQILVFNDNYFDAWQVYLDGQKGEVLRAYGTFRAVELPAGTKEILFKYESERYQTGKMSTLLTSIFLLLVFVSYFGVNYFRKDKTSSIKDN